MTRCAMCQSKLRRFCGIFEGYSVVSVRQMRVSKRTHTHTDQQKINKIKYSRGSPEVPMN